MTARDRMRWTAELACGCKASGECGYPVKNYLDIGDPKTCTAHGETEIVSYSAVSR
jgi:hypothetical protein